MPSVQDAAAAGWADLPDVSRTLAYAGANGHGDFYVIMAIQIVPLFEFCVMESEPRQLGNDPMRGKAAVVRRSLPLTVAALISN